MTGSCRRIAPDAAFQQIRDETRKGDLNSALRDVDSGLSSFGARDSVWGARLRVQKAHILMMRGSYSESLGLLRDTLPAPLRRTDTEVQQAMVEGLNNIFLEQFDPAEKALLRAESLADSIGSSQRGSVAQARGMLEEGRKNYSKAAEEFQLAARLARQQNQPIAELNALGEMGNIAMSQERYDEAIDLFRAALTRARSLNAVGQEATSLGNLGWSYSAVGDFDNAESFFSEALAKATQAGWVADQIVWLTDLAEAYFNQARYPEAQATAQKALELARRQEDKSQLVNCLNVLAETALALDDSATAGRYNDEALQIEKSGSDQSHLDYTRILAGRVEALRHHEALAESIFRGVAESPTAPTQYKWQANGWLAVIYDVQNQPAKAERQFRLVHKSIQDARRGLQGEELRASFLSAPIVFYEAYVNFLIDQNRPIDALKIANLSRAQILEQRFAQSASPTADSGAQFSPQAIARRLNGTLLFYWLGHGYWRHHQRSFLWVVTPSKISVLSLSSTAEIDAAAKSYRESFTDPRDPLESGHPDGKKLYDSLVQPAERLIAKNSRVVVLPDGRLNTLNFETFIVSNPQPHYWIEDVTLTTANSLTQLGRASGSARPNLNKLLLVGNTVSPGPDFPLLPHAAREISLIEKHFPQADRVELTGQVATPSAVLDSHLGDFSYLHFATHGTASRLRPLESAVILSPQGDSSFKLYARDILQHSLHARLVTISACNGAGIRTYAGEGLVGLSWAFLRAGAHNVIAGLWEVSESSTPQLMDELYKNLASGQDPASALRNAKLTLVHSTGVFRKPFYWAPFLLYAGS